MSKTSGKILGTLIFSTLIFVLFYLTFLPKKIIKRTINKIEISGNKFLTENDYLKQTKLSDIQDYNKSDLALIEDRFEKHPYISRADVELKDKTIIAYITEKKMTAVIIKGTNLYLVSNNLEVLPLLPNTKFVDLPVISNPENVKELKPLTIVKDDNLLDAFRLIYALKLTDNTMLNHLSEINLRNGGDIVLTFSGYPVPIIIGRGEEARKIIYLESLLKNQSGSWTNDMLKNTSYIDLRFAGNIYIAPEITNQNAGFIE
jgi:cell division septal protein FtsQ